MEHGRRQRALAVAPVELELLEAAEGGGPEPAVEFGVAVAAEADGFEGEAADGAAVRGEDLGDGGDAVALLPGEVERGGPPGVAPLGGENGVRALAHRRGCDLFVLAWQPKMLDARTRPTEVYRSADLSSFNWAK